MKGVDRYGIPVSLTYKNDPLIRSVTGGVATVLARLVIIVYLGFECKTVFDKKYSMQTSMVKLDLTVDKSMYNLTLRVTQNYYVWGIDSNGNPMVSRKKNRTELVPCSPPRML